MYSGDFRRCVFGDRQERGVSIKETCQTVIDCICRFQFVRDDDARTEQYQLIMNKPCFHRVSVPYYFCSPIRKVSVHRAGAIPQGTIIGIYDLLSERPALLSYVPTYPQKFLHESSSCGPLSVVSILLKNSWAEKSCHILDGTRPVVPKTRKE